MSIRKATLGVAALFLSALSAPLWAAQATMTSTVTQTLATSGERWGGCAARLADGVASGDLNMDMCRNANWVTFDCAGSMGTSKASAQRMFDSAQLAAATCGTVRITVTDEGPLNGMCRSTAIYVSPGPGCSR